MSSPYTIITEQGNTIPYHLIKLLAPNTPHMSEVLVFGGIANVQDVDACLMEVEHTAQDGLVQLFDARYVAGKEHLLSALHKAKRAFERRTNISQRLKLEVMLYAAATRQLNRAFRMGIKRGTCPVAVLVEADDADMVAGKVEGVLSLRRDDRVVECSVDKRDVLCEFFAISELELGCVGEDKLCQLVLERVALLDVEK